MCILFLIKNMCKMLTTVQINSHDSFDVYDYDKYENSHSINDIQMHPWSNG